MSDITVLFEQTPKCLSYINQIGLTMGEPSGFFALSLNFVIYFSITELQAEDMQYRRIKVRGRFDHSRELYIGPRSNVQVESGHGMMSYTHKSGLNVVTPFKLSDRE